MIDRLKSTGKWRGDAMKGVRVVSTAPGEFLADCRIAKVSGDCSNRARSRLATRSECGVPEVRRSERRGAQHRDRAYFNSLLGRLFQMSKLYQQSKSV